MSGTRLLLGNFIQSYSHAFPSLMPSAPVNTHIHTLHSPGLMSVHGGTSLPRMRQADDCKVGFDLGWSK